MVQSLIAEFGPDEGRLLTLADGARTPREKIVPSQRPPVSVQIKSPVFMHYLKSHFAGAAEERLHATYCDGRGDYLHDEILTYGSVGFVATRARLLFGRALALGASGLLLAHNHPSGRCRPSRDDLSATNRLRDIAAALDIVLHDHLILTQNEIYSMRTGGYL